MMKFKIGVHVTNGVHQVTNTFSKYFRFEVELVTHSDADVSFAYACHAKHFIPGGGGFSKLMAKVVRHKGNDVYSIEV